jgi:electron transfer flavoprotein-quinone oxidoreductase
MDDEKVKVDAIVVGGGPAGLAAAYTMAQKEMEVIVVERGEYCGSKNLGGLLYGTILNDMIPNFWEKAPIERNVVKRQVTFLGEDTHAGMTFGTQDWAKPPYNYTYTVHRSQFDRWFAEQVEEAGANLVEGMVVDELIYEGEGADKKAVGVRIRGDEEFYADVIILADGTHSIVTETAMKELQIPGGRDEQHYALGVKETYSLPKKVIEDRFGLADGEGAAYDFMGIPFEGFVGGGFIYTQKETVSIGFVGKLSSLAEREDDQSKPTEIMDKFKNHPYVQRLLRDGELLEYGAHLLPEGGYNSVPQLVGNGVMITGDAAGLLNVSLYKEGTNHAMESGRNAGMTAVKAKEKGDFSKAGLMGYQTMMDDSIAMKDLKKYESLPEIMDSTPEVLGEYPARVNKLLVDYFTMSKDSKKDIQKRAIKSFLTGLPKFKFIRDLIKARKLM